MNIFKLIAWLQLLTWVITILGAFYFIFIQNSPLWLNFIQTGVGIQLVSILISPLLRRRTNTLWLILNVILVGIIIIVELQNRNTLSLQIFKGDSGFIIGSFFLIITIGLYLFSIKFILKDLLIATKN